MALTQPSSTSFTTTSTTQSTSQPHPQMQVHARLQQLNLPPPQTFDILPALHELLARIDHTPLTSITPVNASDDTDALYTDHAPLDPKDLPTEVLAIKTKIRRALKALEQLPDMERSVAEQEEEIQGLEMRIGGQRVMVRKSGGWVGW